ncbi:MAG: SagB/ThcOx family dehydrogenase [Bacteroidales bacterium]|nr:SagB/ThcOx family dehydrogenase [Bacteroidales bacterium]
MKKYLTIFIVFALLGIVAILFRVGSRSMTPSSGQNATVTAENKFAPLNQTDAMIHLPEVTLDGAMSLEKSITLRRSVRSYADKPLSMRELSQLLWSAQGITSERGFRTAPSAGATFPLEMFVVVNHVAGLTRGIYHYRPHSHVLELVRSEDVSEDLFRACLSQSMILKGGAVLVFAAVLERTTARYGERGIRYVYNEVGHASQNVHLQAAALDLGTVVIGAYRDDEVEDILKLGDSYRVLYLMPVGKLR